MKRLGLLWGICLIAGLALSGCEAKEQSKEVSEKEGKVVARVNGKPITEEDLSFRQVNPHGMAKTGADQKKELDEVIREELLYQQGLKLGLDKDPGYQRQIARLERQLENVKRREMTRRVYNTQVAAKVDISLQDARDYYEKNKEQITTELHLGVILLDNNDQAEEALKKIRGGTPFETVAQSRMGKEKRAGRDPWDLGFISWDRIPSDFLETVYALKAGQVSEVAHTKRTGYEIFKVYGSRKNEKAGFDKMSGIIRNRLRDKRLMEAYDQYVETLKKEAKVEYSGR